MLILVLVFVLIKKNLKLKKEMENLKLLLKLTEDDFDEYFNKYWELKKQTRDLKKFRSLYIFSHLIIGVNN